MKTFILSIICIATLIAFATNDKCWHYCVTCGCDYSDPAYCTTCPAIKHDGWSHWRKIQHIYICDVCRDHEHDGYGAGEEGDDDSGPHTLFECPSNCHYNVEYDDGYPVESGA